MTDILTPAERQLSLCEPNHRACEARNKASKKFLRQRDKLHDKLCVQMRMNDGIANAFRHPAAISKIQKDHKP